MKLRGGVWVADTSDAAALAAELKLSAAATLKLEKPTTGLLRYSQIQDQLATGNEFATQPLNSSAWSRPVMQ